MKTRIILSLIVAVLLESCAAKPMYYRRGLIQEDSKNTVEISKEKPILANVKMSGKAIDSETKSMLKNKLNKKS